ncbi:MAG: PLP-dependent aminotransferase family protein [Chloroflexi bacterium]|nr:PLP-dependent aminotransferase family protein [Chloroflexota bacterium]
MTRNQVRMITALGQWTDGSGALYRRLATAIQRAIERGDLRAGEKLPAERNLAHSLAVSRTTVGNAYALLKVAGWLESRQGSNTWVRGPRVASTEADPIASLRSNAFLRDRIATATTIDFATAALPGIALIAEVTRAVAQTELPALLNSHGYMPAGLPQLREMVAQRFAEQGTPTTPQQILITTGDQQAVTLLITHYFQPGDVAVTETLTSPGVLDALRKAGARIYPVPIDDQGADLASLSRLLKQLPIRLVYLMPTFHNPTGSVMSADRRRRLAQLARDLQVTVIEDLSHSELPLDDDPLPPPVTSYEPDGQVIAIGSASKLFWGGLRAGWIRASENVIRRLVHLKASVDLGTPVISQLVTTQLLQKADGIAEQRRAELRTRLNYLLELLTAHLPEWSWQRPRGGVSLWVRLPDANADDFGQIALQHGVALVSGSLLSPNGEHAGGIRLSFGLDLPVLEVGVRRLAEAWSAYQMYHRKRSPACGLLDGVLQGRV